MAQETAPRMDSSERSPVVEAASGNSRRDVLLGTGLVCVAGLTAACGGSDDGDNGGDAQSPAGNNETGNAGGAGGAALAQASEIPVGGGKVFKDQKVVVTQPTQGQFKAFSSKCPHRGCDVDSVTGTDIVCPCHQSKFSIKDGSVTNPPAKEPLAEKQITVQGGQITLA